MCNLAFLGSKCPEICSRRIGLWRRSRVSGRSWLVYSHSCLLVLRKEKQHTENSDEERNKIPGSIPEHGKGVVREREPKEGDEDGRSREGRVVLVVPRAIFVVRHFETPQKIKFVCEHLKSRYRKAGGGFDTVIDNSHIQRAAEEAEPGGKPATRAVPLNKDVEQQGRKQLWKRSDRNT